MSSRPGPDFSVRDLYSNKPVATLSLIWEDEYWQLDQLKGFKNSDLVVDQNIFFDGESLCINTDLSDLYFAAQELLLRCRAAWARDNEWFFLNR
jgi:hypothetical protein